MIHGETGGPGQAPRLVRHKNIKTAVMAAGTELADCKAVAGAKAASPRIPAGGNARCHISCHPVRMALGVFLEQEGMRVVCSILVSGGAPVRGGAPGGDHPRRHHQLSRGPLGRRGRRCSRLTRTMSGSRGSSGNCGSSWPRRPARPVRRCLVIRICDILTLPRFGSSRSLPSRVARERPDVVIACTGIGARRASIPSYRLAGTPADGTTA